MTGQVLQLDSIIQPDRLGTEISKMQYTWHMLRQPWLAEQEEIRQYLYATDTKKTSNKRLPWRNTTTIPKLCQVNDNLFANYWMALFPKRKNVVWEAYDRSSNTQEKKFAIESYMCETTDQRNYKNEMKKCVLDYIQTGNAFGMAVWVDDRVETDQGTRAGYVGPSWQRISHLDITFNPLAPSFEQTPKIIRSILHIGEVKKLLESLSSDDNRDEYEKLYQYLKEIRNNVQGYGGELKYKDNFYEVDGFTNYQAYLQSNYCEVLTFYGDIYDQDNDTFLENQIIMVVDRHKVISKKANPSWFGRAPIHHVGWRIRQDNLYAMGPLSNLVGLQYRIDHLENLKADVMDLIAYPVLKIRGYVDDFEWGPLARIHVGDNDGDVEMLAPPFQILQIDQELQFLMNLMEEMAGAPKEAMGFRTPGEKTKYEVQRMENSASRIFQNKTTQFEEGFIEPAQNDMLEIGRRKTTSDMLVKYTDDEFQIDKFLDLTVDDISGYGRIKPYAARHFAEQAELVQNLTNLFGSPLGQVLAPHFSSIKLARLFEDLFDIKQYKLVLPYVADAEQADRQRIAQAQMEAVMIEALTPSGLTPEDTSLPFTAPGPDGQAVPATTGLPQQGLPQPPAAPPQLPVQPTVS